MNCVRNQLDQQLSTDNNFCTNSSRATQVFEGQYLAFSAPGTNNILSGSSAFVRWRSILPA